ncbi:RPGR family protein [Megaselia abdita]
MDIPESGAVFTLGKSHLAENTQSYFYIKGDPVVALKSGEHQSAVICESGRLFVWGENQYGQLGIGGNANNGGETVTRPTCVKTLKSVGLRVKNVAYGMGWSAILTHNNQIYFTGRNIFPNNSKLLNNFTNANVGSGERSLIVRKPFLLEQFNGLAREDFVNIVAGSEHFVLLTSKGRAFGWGSNTKLQLGVNDKKLPEPVEIRLGDPIKLATCGPNSTLFLTTTNKLYITGHLKEYSFTSFVELQQNLSEEEITFVSISNAHEIFIITSLGNIYRSFETSRHKNLVFQRFYDYDSEENGQIKKLLKGTSFYTALTKSNKFYTTFSESGHHLKTFREISKLKNVKTVEMAVGDQHILVLGVPKGSLRKDFSMDKTFVMINPDLNGNVKEEEKEVENGNDIESTEEEKKEDFAVGEENNKEEVMGKEIESLETCNAEQEKDEIKTLDEGSVEEMHEVKEIKDDEKMMDEISEVEQKAEALMKGVEDAVDIMLNESVEKQQEDITIDVNEESIENKDSVETEKNMSPKSMNSFKEEPRHLSPPVATADDTKSIVSTAESSLVSQSPTSTVVSVISRKNSVKSITFTDEPETARPETSSEKLPRPRTPYPEDLKSPIVEKESEDESGAYEDSLENIPEASDSRRPSLKYSDRNRLNKEKLDEISRKVSSESLLEATEKVLPLSFEEEDEQLTIEIKSDPLDKTVKEEIRFINNGIDVTDKVEEVVVKTPETETEKEEEQTITASEEDERTTASVNSNQTTINAIDNDNDIEIDPLDHEITEVKKLPLEPETAPAKKRTVRGFINEMKAKGKGISCRSDKSVRVDDEPPKYTPVDEHLELEGPNKTSQVCTIL